MSRSPASGRATDLKITACTAGGERATAVAGMPDRVSEPLPLADFPNDPIPPPDARPPASPEVLGAITLGVVERTWHADLAGDYLLLVSDELAAYRDPPVAHPGWLLRAANYVLSRSVRLGPWIHVESTVQNHSVVTDGEVVATRGPRRRPVRAGRPPVRRARRAHVGR